MTNSNNISVYGTTSNSIPKQVERRVSHKDREIFGLSFPIGGKKDTGGHFSKSSGVELVKGAVKQLMQTKKGERVMHPSFGVDLEKYLFEPLDQDVFEQIKAEILYAFNRYIVGAKLLKLKVVPVDSITVAGGNGLVITLILALDKEPLKTFDVEVEIS